VIHLNRALAEARHVPRTVQLVWAATARWTAVWLVLLLVQGLLPALALYLTKQVVDGLAVALKAGAGWPGMGPVAAPAAVLGLVALAIVLSRVAANWVEALQAGLLQDHISGLIHEKSANVQMAFYDFPEFYDHLHRAREEASYRPERLLNVLGGLLQNGITLVAVALVLIPYGGWRLPAVLLLSTAPTLCLVVTNALRRQEWQRGATTIVRRGTTTGS
jgi:ATP-binding cassette subfamily B protein